MTDLWKTALMAGITLPASFLIARAGLSYVIRVVERNRNRHVLSSRP